MKKKILFSALAVILIVAISVAGTLAVLTKQTDPVVNTFTASSGITDNKDSDAFTLKEHQPTWNATNNKYDAIDASTASVVTTVAYDHASPKMEIPKDPTIKVNMLKDASAYLFVKIENGTNGFITYEVADGWTEVGSGSGVYAYNTVLVGTENSATSAEYPAIQVLKGSTAYGTGAVNVIDYNESTSGLPAANDGKISFGNLKLTAYLVQAESFADAAAAWAGSGFAA